MDAELVTTSQGRRVALRISIFTSKGENPILADLLKRSQAAPGLIPYILGQVAGRANPIAQAGVFSGSLPGFSSRTSGPTTTMGKPGDAKRIGLKATFKSTELKTYVNLWSPFANLFENFTKRPQVHILQQAAADINASGIIMETIENELEKFARGEVGDLDKYIVRSGKRRKK
jgi:hypothetical protein